MTPFHGDGFNMLYIYMYRKTEEEKDGPKKKTEPTL
jgi:hypothetical protein